MPPEYEEILLAAGLTVKELQENPRSAMHVAKIHFSGGISQIFDNHQSLKESVTLKMLMKKAVKMKTLDPKIHYEYNLKRDRIGGGAFGEVYICRGKKKGQKFAMKVSGDDKFRIIDREIRMHALSNGHRNIVKFIDAYHYKHKLYLILEFMNSGSLFDYIYDLPSNYRWKQGGIAYATKCIIRGLEHMHFHYHLHRDIKSQNILVNAEGEVKIADFGFAVGLTKHHQNRKTVLGSPFWMAPELIAKSPYGPKVDIWSTGIVAIELAEKKPPHMGQPAIKVLFSIHSKPPPKLRNKKHWSKHFHHFLKSALYKDPKRRATAAELLMHPFLCKESIFKRKQFAHLIQHMRSIIKKSQGR